MINKVTLIGNLGGDPELRRLENGAAVARLSVATNESYKDKAGEWQTLTEWHTVIVWRELAERCEQKLKKGMQVFVEGKLRTRSWGEGNDKKYATEIVANTVRKLGRSDNQEREGYFPSEEPQNTTTQPKENAKNDSPPAADDDLPF